MTKGIYPHALQLLIAPGSNDPAITPRVAILHVDAGNASSLFSYFKYRSGGIESHFFVRSDGVVEQYRNIFWQADANLDANDFAVSIETQGYGSGKWNDKQLASIKALLIWLNGEAGIPLHQVGKWDGEGVGYHTLFGAPSHWTPVAKSCPGPSRKVQFHGVLVPWMDGLKGKPMAAPLHPKPKRNNVQKGRDKLRQAVRQFQKVPKDRTRSRRAIQKIRDVLNTTPKK